MTKLNLFILSIVSLIFFACYNQQIDFKDDQSSTLLIDFHGLQINHGERDIRALTYNLENYQSEYLSKFSILKGETNATLENVDYPSLAGLALIESKEIVKYPDIYRMDDSDIKMIQENFPTLSDEGISLNLELIGEYYERNLKFDIFQSIVKSLKKIVTGIIQEDCAIKNFGIYLANQLLPVP